MDELLKTQLEWARKLRLHQDLLRFGIPGGYLAVIGASAKFLLDGRFHSMLWLGLAIVGIGVFFATMNEHYFYVVYRNWERHLEELSANSKYVPSVARGESVSPVPEEPGVYIADDGQKTRINIRTISSARNLPDVKQPDLAHTTALVALLGVALSVAVFVYCWLVAIVPEATAIGSIAGAVSAIVLISSYKFWYSWHVAFLTPLLKRLRTR